MSRSLAIGTTINGYRVERTLSEGGNFAVVYLAFDTDSDRVARRREKVAGRLERWRDRYGAAAAAADMDPGPFVALKEYIPKYYGIRRGQAVAAVSGQGDVFAWGRERFERESKFLSEHSHPNVVAVYDLFSANNTEYYVMERLAGGSLRDLVSRAGPQSEGQVREWLVPTLEGLASVERRDANHLDLSPDNIMFRRAGGEPVLVDFGASRIGGSPPKYTTRLVINDSFAAPEKYTMTSSKLSAQTDIYSLGGIVNFALTGEEPIAANERLAGAAPFTIEAASRRGAKAAASFIRVVDQAFATDRDARFPDARAFLEAVASGSHRHVVSSDFTRGAGSRPRVAVSDRNLIILALAIAALILLAAALALVIGKA